MAVLIFKERVKHQRLDLVPTIAIGFEDEALASYFVSCGWADPAPAEAVPVYTILDGEASFDAGTVFGSGDNRGKLVVGGVE